MPGFFILRLPLIEIDRHSVVSSTHLIDRVTGILDGKGCGFRLWRRTESAAICDRSLFVPVRLVASGYDLQIWNPPLNRTWHWRGFVFGEASE